MMLNILLAICLVYADIIRDDRNQFFEGLFNMVHKGRMLRVLMSFNDVEMEICAVNCAEHLRCRTFNYHHDKKDCELTDEDFNEMNLDTITLGWYNYGIPPKIDGGWSMWRNLTVCTKKCSNGTFQQWRDCDSPKPEYGGANCEGKMIRTVICNTHECEVVNLAVNKKAKQSTTTFPHYASKAIDGTTTSVAITLLQDKPWWQVDLGGVKVIKKIRLALFLADSRSNKGLIVETRKNNGEPWIICKDFGSLIKSLLVFECDDLLTNAWYFKIRSTRFGYLRLREVGIFGYYEIWFQLIMMINGAIPTRLFYK